MIERLCTRPLPEAIREGLPHDVPDRPGWMAGLALFAAILAATPDARANNYTVTADGDPGTGGLSLRQAVALAMTAPNSVIEFDPRLVGSTITLTQGAIGITKAVAITGPGADKITISGGKTSRIFSIEYGQPSPPVTISGLTLADGYSSANDGGAAIASTGTSLVIENSVLSGNTGFNVGALSIFGGNVAYYTRLDNVTIANNVTTGPKTSALTLSAGFKDAHLTALLQNCRIIGNTGTGIYSSKYADLTIKDSTISGNSGKRGGGIYAKYEPNLSIIGSTISGNSATNGGSGVFLNDSAASFTLTQITGNTTSGDGGGILVTGYSSPTTPYSLLALTDSSVSNNTAYTYGAGIDVKRAVTVTIERSLISGNDLNDFSNGAGGGLALQSLSGKTTIDNSTFYHNFAYRNGGGIGIFNATVGNNTKITSSTIVGNGTAYFYSNGILGAGQPYVGSSIIANNASRLYSQDVVGSFLMKYTLVENPGGATITGIYNIGGDPQLAPLAMNGGPTMTLLPAVTSPVINAGSPLFVTTTLDQRGVPRTVGGTADMGAVERQNPEVMIMRNGFE